MNIWLIFFYLQVLDVLTTLLGLSLGTPEANPFIDFFIQRWGAYGLIFIKMIAASFIFLLVKLTFKTKWPMSIINFYFMALILWNFVGSIIKIYSFTSPI